MQNVGAIPNASVQWSKKTWNRFLNDALIPSVINLFILTLAHCVLFRFRMHTWSQYFDHRLPVERHGEYTPKVDWTTIWAICFYWIPATHHDCVPSTICSAILAICVSRVSIGIQSATSFPACGLDTGCAHGALFSNVLHTRNLVICSGMVPPAKIDRTKVLSGLNSRSNYSVSQDCRSAVT